MEPRAMTKCEERMAEDFTWAEHSPDVQQNPEYFGKLVVVYEKQVLAVGRDRHAIMVQAARRAGVPGEQLVAVLVPRPDLSEIPH